MTKKIRNIGLRVVVSLAMTTKGCKLSDLDKVIWSSHKMYEELGDTSLLPSMYKFFGGWDSIREKGSHNKVLRSELLEEEL